MALQCRGTAEDEDCVLVAVLTGARGVGGRSSQDPSMAVVAVAALGKSITHTWSHLNLVALHLGCAPGSRARLRF